MIGGLNLKIGVLFGSSSNEHEVSVISAASIIKNLDKKKYDITPIYLDKANNFYKWKKKLENIEPKEIGILPTKLKKINNPFKFLKSFDCIFLMIHGKNGEDGILSSILDFLNIKYVGNKTLPSVITMDKIYTKEILERNGITTSPYLYFMKYNQEYILKGNSYSLNEIINHIENTLSYPLFIKPSNSGSSIGITKAKNKKELNKGILKALKVDHRILVEQEIIGRELEVGVLEKEGQLITSVVGEIKSAEEYYSFSAKYSNKASKTIIPAELEKELEKQIQEEAIKIFKTLDLHQYSRCDFFLTNDNKVILNEINTIPGFTNISMYPSLFEASKVPYQELLDTLISEVLKVK